MRQYDRQRRREDRTHRHVRDHHDVDPDHDVVADMYGSEDARSSAYIHSVPQLRRSPLISTAARDEGVGPQIAFRPYDAARTYDDASKMGNVEARTNVGCRCDRDTSQNLDRPSSQVVQEATPPSFQSPLLVRPMPEPVRSSGKDPRLRCQYDRQRTPAVPAVRVVDVPFRVGAEQRANVVETLRAAFRTLIGVQSLHGTVLSFGHNHCNHMKMSANHSGTKVIDRISYRSRRCFEGRLGVQSNQVVDSSDRWALDGRAVPASERLGWA